MSVFPIVGGHIPATGPLPTEWTQNSGSNYRKLEVGMEIRTSDGELYVIMSAAAMGAQARPLKKVQKTIGDRTFKTTGKPVLMCLYSSCEYRRISMENKKMATKKTRTRKAAPKARASSRPALGVDDQATE